MKQEQDELLDYLPENLRTVIQLTDYRTALTLINQFGGTDYIFPPLKSITESHELAKLIGFNNLKKLCQYWDCCSVYIPKADRYLNKIRNMRIKEDLEQLGATVGKDAQIKIAKAHGVTTRHIRKLRQELKRNAPPPAPSKSRQLDMFG